MPPIPATILALNNAHAAELSPLDAARLDALAAMAFHADWREDGTALLLAFDQDADYDSPNFLWFRAHYPRFVYVDRVVVAPAQRGRGLARRLYLDLFARARVAGHTLVACEVNADPPNPASDAFHAALGFAEVGRGRVGPKTVQYLTCAIGGAAQIAPRHDLNASDIERLEDRL